MTSDKILPFLWLRLVAIIGFTVFVAWQSLWIVAAVGVFLMCLTGYHIIHIRRNRPKDNAATEAV